MARRVVEANVVKTPDGVLYFGSGQDFGLRIYTRDIAYSGVLGLNREYPELMASSLEVSREARWNLQFRVTPGHDVREIPVDWQIHDGDELDLIAHYQTNSYTRHSDDAVWLWAASDLKQWCGDRATWSWIYETGARFFETFYEPWRDPETGLFFGQSSFVDIHFAGARRTSGYPVEFELKDCVLLKALSTNCLFYKAMEVMAEASDALDQPQDAESWRAKARAHKENILKRLTGPDGQLRYYLGRDGKLAEQRHALGIALAVLFDILEGEAAVRALELYPRTDWGFPLFVPFLPGDHIYHNHSAWPFVDAFMFLARKKALGIDESENHFRMLEKAIVDDSLMEVCDVRNGIARGSRDQLWTAAAAFSLLHGPK